ncbi:MAG: hypothetical protein M1828_003516 [Chrysothrix sp. TS-e1954]|nr:MAG: hypothetical protein M1828_003516 [Chrysothrix sp. TS-e1954]
MNDFQRLVQDLSDFLGPSSGLDSSEINPDRVIEIMRSYTTRSSEWSPYAHADHGRGYTRNLVDTGNGKSNLLVLVWNPSKGSPVHDHANAHCVMKILRGTLEETLYEPPRGSSPPKAKKRTLYREDEVTYMSDQLGLHKIINPDANHVAVSLHRE